MQVKECMTRDVQTIAPCVSIAEAAQLMRDADVGIIPVAKDDRLIGMITDRDIVVRIVAEGICASATVRDAMTHDIECAFEDEEMSVVSRRMSELKVRRLPVLTREKRLCGIISLGDMARGDPHVAGAALAGASQPGQPHASMS